jgi:signal transduction histidine kinase
LNFIPKAPADEAFRVVLGDLAGPACILDVTSCELLAANEAGNRLWGTAGVPLPCALDSAMPVLAVLRRLMAVAALDVGASARVTFWTRQGALSGPCTVRLLPLQLCRTAVLVTWPAGAGTNPERDAPLRRADNADSPAKGVAAADIATMRQIARRIRERPASLDPRGVSSGRAADADASEASAEHGAEHERHLLAKLSHELRTPLAAVIALAEVMTEEHLGPLPNERYRGYMRDILDSTRHALALIDGMVEHRNIETGQLELVFAEIDLNEAADACIATIRPLADKAGITLSASLAEHLPNVIADRRCIKQILLNLLTNSVKYAGAGAEVSVRSGYELAGSVWIEVVDTGPGIPADVVARTLAAPHTRTERRADNGERVGLGLPLSHQLAHANGARLQMMTCAGRGTCVRMIFAKDRAVPV